MVKLAHGLEGSRKRGDMGERKDGCQDSWSRKGVTAGHLEREERREKKGYRIGRERVALCGVFL